jgi:small-conductance mechanosensitive channel
MPTLIRIQLVLALVLFLSIPGMAAEQKPPPLQKPSVPSPAATIPAPEIAKRAEEVAKLLRELDALAAPDPAIDAISARMPEVSARLAPLLESTTETLKGEPSNPVIERLAQTWQASRLELTGWVQPLTKRAVQLEAALRQLSALRNTWTQTRADAEASRTPAAVVHRVDAILADIEAMRTRLQTQRAATLVLQDKVGQEVAHCQDALDRIAQYRQGRLMRTFVRSTPAIWSPELRGVGLTDLPERAHEAAIASLGVLRQFAETQAVRLFFQGLLFVAVVLALRTARRRSRDAAAAEKIPPSSIVLDRPYSAAAVVALTSIFWLYPDRPQTIVDVVAILLLLPLLRIVRPHVTPALVPALYGLATLCFVDRVRAELAVIPLADQILLLLTMLAAMAGLGSLLGSGRLRRAPALGSWYTSPAAAAAGLTVCAASFAAAAYGTMRLARLLGAGFLVGVLMALVAYSAVQVTDGLLSFALRVRPLRRLGMVVRHREFLQRRLHTLICWIAAFAWVIGTLRFHALLQPAIALGKAVLDAEVRRGAMAISLGDLLSFGLTVWVAFLASAFIRFVLGVPYVISSLLHYAVLFLGFLLAVAALGVDLNKVTVLAGAFGVGLGFGLQGVVNNFVSGLIVLFERPIRVGDAIQMGDVAGEVQRIGIRMTMVRTWEGADVIVPNASLVSEKVTNWTHRDLLRRIDVPVGVAYGSAPKEVQALLLAVARAHPGVLAEPAPEALFLGFGESALNFELRAWTSRFSQWVTIRSELGVAVHDAIYGAGMTFPYPHRVIQLLRDSETESLTAPVTTAKRGSDMMIERDSTQSKKGMR